MPSSMFCAGCRAETHLDHLRADAAGYYYCEPCRPELFQKVNKHRGGDALAFIQETINANPEAKAEYERISKTE